jgi:hypothetical protein
MPLIWSQVEVCAVILCSCLPLFRQAWEILVGHRLPVPHHSTTRNVSSPQQQHDGRHAEQNVGKGSQKDRHVFMARLRRGLKKPKKRRDDRRHEKDKGSAKKITAQDKMAWIDALAFQAVWLKGGRLGTQSHVEARSPDRRRDAASDRHNKWRSPARGLGTSTTWPRVQSPDSAWKGSPEESVEESVEEQPPWDVMSGANGIFVTREFLYEVEENPSRDECAGGG